MRRSQATDRRPADRSCVHYRAGFTLAELLVAATLLSAVMAAVYVAFSGTARIARMGEENLVTMQQARIALDVMERDLHGVLPYSWHLFEPGSSSFGLYTLTSSMQADIGEFPRMLWVNYRLRRNNQQRAAVLVREERVVEGPLPLKLPGTDEPIDIAIKTGRNRAFDMAEGIESLKIEYVWVVAPEDAAPVEEAPQGEDGGSTFDAGSEAASGDVVVPEPAQVVVREDVPEDWELPQAIRITLTVFDTSAPSGRTTFTSHVVFRASPPTLDAEDAEIAV